MIEDNSEPVLKLCALLYRGWAQEQKLARAQYQVSYFRKIRAALTSSKPRKNMPDGCAKWKGNLRGLEKEIETARLREISYQGERTEFKKKMHIPLFKALTEAQAAIVFEGGKIVGINVSSGDGRLKFISKDQFEAFSDEYEANSTMNKIFRF